MPTNTHTHTCTPPQPNLSKVHTYTTTYSHSNCELHCCGHPAVLAAFVPRAACRVATATSSLSALCEVSAVVMCPSSGFPKHQRLTVAPKAHADQDTMPNANQLLLGVSVPLACRYRGYLCTSELPRCTADGHHAWQMWDCHSSPLQSNVRPNSGDCCSAWSTLSFLGAVLLTRLQMCNLLEDTSSHMDCT